MKSIHAKKSFGLFVPDTNGGRARLAGIMHPDDFKAHLAWVLAKRDQNQ